jgi:hypothetical protein
MISLTFGLTLATYASAQVVSMIPNPNLAGASGSASSASASASYPMSAAAAATSSSGSDSSGYSTPPSANQYGQYDSSSSPYNQYGSSSTPSYNQYGSSSTPSYNQYTSAPAQYTPPPQTEAMPYSSFMSGGYKSMDCGYGYTKGSDGSCMSTESWVRTSHLEISRAMQFMRSDHTVYYLRLLSDVSVVPEVNSTFIMGR